MFQEQLPKLPVPPLEETLKKYEKTLQPLLNEQEQLRVHKIVESFKNGLGAKLQLYLVGRREKMDNWVGFNMTLGFNMTYLRYITYTIRNWDFELLVNRTIVMRK